MNTKVRIGVIGVGTIGSVHAKKIYDGEICGMSLSALCDIDPRRQEELSEQFCDVPVFSSHKDLIESGAVDAVIISTPHYDHPKIAIDAFRRGLHVLSEKPIGVYCKAAKEMIKAADESKKIFAVMFNQRTNKLYSEAKRIIDSGELGEIRRSVFTVTNWYRKQSYYDSGDWRGTWSGEGGGVLMNQAPHNLDLWQWICGMPTKIFAKCCVGKYHNIEVEDDATIYAEYANGASGIFITSTGDYPGTNRLEITASKGKLVIEGGKLTLYVSELDEAEYNTSESLVSNKVTVTEICDEKYNGHIEVLKNFARAILYGEPLIADGREGLCELSICNAAYFSSHVDSSVALPVDEDKYFEFLKERIETAGSCEKTLKKESPEFEYKQKWTTNW